jgi:hypothetical protein
MTYRLTRRAPQDISDIWKYIADDNERAADSFVDLLTRHFSLLGDNPYAGRRRVTSCELDTGAFQSASTWCFTGLPNREYKFSVFCTAAATSRRSFGNNDHLLPSETARTRSSGGHVRAWKFSSTITILRTWR